MPARLSQLTARIREILRDPLYRGSLILLINTAIIAGLGLGFWTLAARAYPAATVGAFSGLSSGIGLVSTVASIGLPNMVTRHLASSDSPRGLLIVATAVISALGGGLCAIVVLALGPYLPASLHLQAHGWTALLFTALAILTSLNGTWSAGLVVLRLPQVVLWTNLAGALSKLLFLYLLVSMRSSGLVIAFSIGLTVSALTGLPPLVAKAPWGNGMSGSFAIFREHLSVTANNYVATIFGALPTTVMPLEIIAARGPAQAAPFALAFMLTGFLNTIPSTMSQLVFAESSRRGAQLGAQVRKAIRGIYSILIPLLLITVPAAPLVMHVFGSGYSVAGTAPFRILALTTLATAGNYLVDSMLIARDRSVAYLSMNGVNAALVLGFAGALVQQGGITGAAEGWSLAQVISLLLGLIVLATGKTGRHRRGSAVVSSAEIALPLGKPDKGQDEEIRALSIHITGSVRTTLPLMLGTVTGTDKALRGLSSSRAHGPRPVRPKQRFARAGEVVFFGIWFPPMAVPVGARQIRSSRELPMLIAFSAYSGWLTALLLPSLSVPDVLAGSWELLCRLGGMPQHAVWDVDWMCPELAGFFGSLGVRTIPAAETEESIIRQMYDYVKRKFMPGQTVYSPERLGERLAAWLENDNAYAGDGESESPATLAIPDRKEMARLPERPHATKWQLKAYVQGKPFVEFDSNDYAVDPAVIGMQVCIVADLWNVEVYYDAKRIAAYPRSWEKNAIISTLPQ